MTLLPHFSMSSRVSVLLASAAVVSWGFGLLEIALVTVGCNIFNLFIQVLILRQRISGLNLFPRFRFNSAQEIFQQNGWYWLQSVIALIGFFVKIAELLSVFTLTWLQWVIILLLL